jgi:monomeric isocitrate dehydrogenase
MTEAHKRFADKYFETLNASKSAVYAGYSENSSRQQAYELLQRDDIQEYLEKLREQEADNAGISRKWIVERFKSISDRCIQAEPVMIRVGKEMVQATDEEGRGIFMFDSNGANTATAHLGKILGVFEKDNLQKVTNVKILNVDPLANVANDDRSPEDISASEKD